MFILSVDEVQGNVKVLFDLETGDVAIQMFVCHLIRLILCM